MLEKECCGRISGNDIRTAPAVDAIEVVRCNECAYRGYTIHCPMCFEETYYDDDGYSEYYTVDHTVDDGFCHCGTKEWGNENDTLD